MLIGNLPAIFAEWVELGSLASFSRNGALRDEQVYSFIVKPTIKFTLCNVARLGSLASEVRFCVL